MPNSKALHRFLNRIAYYTIDIELTDLLVDGFKTLPNTNDRMSEAFGGQLGRYERLDNRANTQNSRKLVGNHLRKTINTAYIKELHEDFSEFLATSMSRAALAGVDPARFTGEIHLEIPAKELLKIGNWDSIAVEISDKIFRTLENEKSTKSLISKICNRLGLNLPENLLDNAMPYLDARHILVHRDGMVDEKYKKDYPAIQSKDGKLLVNYAFTKRATFHVTALAKHIDDELIGKGFVRQQDMIGAAL